MRPLARGCLRVRRPSDRREEAQSIPGWPQNQSCSNRTGTWTLSGVRSGTKEGWGGASMQIR